MTEKLRTLAQSGVAEEALHDFVSETRFRVRYAETDQMGVVYYANYIVWMELGRTEYCRQRGFTYREMEDLHDAFLMVVEVNCRYKAPARYDDQILVRTRIRRLQRRTVEFIYEISEETSGKLLATGDTKHVVTNRQGRPTSFPKEYHLLLSEDSSLPERESAIEETR